MRCSLQSNWTRLIILLFSWRMGRSPLGAGFQSVLDEDDFFISSKLSWLDTESLVDENIGVENAFFDLGILGFVQILIHIDNEKVVPKPRLPQLDCRKNGLRELIGKLFNQYGNCLHYPVSKGCYISFIFYIFTSYRGTHLQGGFFNWSALKMTKCQITCKSLPKSSKCQNFLRVWH